MEREPAKVGLGTPAVKHRHYGEPPVVEALAEVYFKGSQWDPTVPGLFYRRVSDRFPTIDQANSLQIGIEIGPTGPSATPSVSDQRARFRAEDGSRMVQLSDRLLVFNRLRPYDRFEEWQGDFADMLAIYRELAKPSAFTRIGVRYLNKIVVPEEQFKLSKYFRIYPEVPDEIGSPFSGFLLRVQIHPPMHASHALVTTFGSSETEDGKPALLLDFYDIIEGGETGDLEVIERLVAEAHANIAVAFEHAVTDDARAIFREEAR